MTADTPVTPVTPDVLVIGAGVIGASCAFHLARAGLSVTVVDGAPSPDPDAGPGSTARATGGIRAQFATAINIRLSLLARRKLASFRDDTGVDPGFSPVGYLWLAGTAAQVDALAEANALQLREGLADARLVGPSDIRAINPFIATPAIAGGAWCPSDGVMRPREIRRGYLEAAARLGVDVRWGERVTSIARDSASEDRLARVVTSYGAAQITYSPGLVIDAAGAWAGSVAKLAGIDIPIAPLRRQVAITTATDALPASFPMTIWLDDGFHLRVRDGRVLLLRPTPGDPDDPWNDRVDPTWLDAIRRDMTTRVPALHGVSLDREASWAGLYEMSPDGHALVGRAPGVSNLVIAGGNSGHGVMHAPAIGQLVAELVTDTPPSLDIHALRPSRLVDNEPIAGSSLL